jgi:co-chaperonin GroES (HSP10)
MNSEIKLHKDRILLDVNRDTINPEEIVGGIIIPHSEKHALTKTITCKIKQINEDTSKKYNLFVGDMILVDRYAIISHNKMNDASKPFHAIIDVNNVLMKKVK